jgi:hypothetical protein
MFRHVSLFTFTPETTQERQQELARQLRTLPGAIQEIKDYHVGPDAGLNPGNYQFGIVADFASVEDYLVYRDHPVHRSSSRRTSGRSWPTARPSSTSFERWLD